MNKIIGCLFLVFLLCFGFFISAELTAAPADLPKQEAAADFQPVMIDSETGAVVPAEPVPTPAPDQEAAPAPEAEVPQEPPLPLSEAVLQDASTCFTGVTSLTSPNHELQIYLQEQTSFHDNHVVLTADYFGDQYISGRAETLNSFRYGTFAFRVPVLHGKGLFPAIWMLPADGSEFPEIDIYEMIGNYPEWVYGVLHYTRPEYTQRQREFFKYIYQFGIPETSVIRFEWTEDYLKWYVDDILCLTVTHDVPNVPMYLILNLAVGGDWPGDPDSETVFPTQFDVEILEFNPVEILEPNPDEILNR